MKLMEIKSVDGAKVHLDLEKVAAVVIPNRFNPGQQVATIVAHGVNIQLSIQDAEDVVKVMYESLSL